MRHVRDEVATVVGANPLASDHLNQLHYLDLVDTRNPTPLPAHSYRQPQSRPRRAPARRYHPHRQPRHVFDLPLPPRPAQWENPETFDPDRFDRQAAVPAFTYVPFGGGPRNCIGATFAQIEAKVVMARLFQRTRLDILPDRQPTPAWARHSTHVPGVKMKVTKHS